MNIIHGWALFSKTNEASLLLKINSSPSTSYTLSASSGFLHYSSVISGHSCASLSSILHSGLLPVGTRKPGPSEQDSLSPLGFSKWGWDFSLQFLPRSLLASEVCLPASSRRTFLGKTMREVKLMLVMTNVPDGCNLSLQLVHAELQRHRLAPGPFLTMDRYEPERPE